MLLCLADSQLKNMLLWSYCVVVNVQLREELSNCWHGPPWHSDRAGIFLRI